MLPKKPALPKPPKPTTSVKSPMKMGSTAVKMPKQKTLPGADAKPSVFFKNEKFNGVTALSNFLESVATKKAQK